MRDIVKLFLVALFFTAIFALFSGIWNHDIRQIILFFVYFGGMFTGALAEREAIKERKKA